MFGLFDLLNLLVSTVYPIVGTFRAYDSYSQLAAKTGATTLNVGGVSIPLGTILRRATADDAGVEDDTLNFRLLTVQMWVVYWIVHACVGLVESAVPSFVPLYSLARLCGSLWLVYPIVLSTTRTRKSQVLSHADIQHEWVVFSSTGCGFVYFVHLKPFLEENLARLRQANLGPLTDVLRGKSLAVAQYLFKAETASKLFTREPGAMSDLADYDVVDKAESENAGTSSATEKRWW